MRAFKLKGITCVVTDITVSEKDQRRGQAVLHMGCGATRTHHPTKANRLTDGPITCMDCMAKGSAPWDPSEHLKLIMVKYIECKIRGQFPSTNTAPFGSRVWRRRDANARALRLMGYLGPPRQDGTYTLLDTSLSFFPEAKPNLVKIGVETQNIKSREPGVPWHKLEAEEKKYVFLHPEEYTFYSGGGYGQAPTKSVGDMAPLKKGFSEYGEGFRLEDKVYAEAYRQEHYDQAMRKLRRERFSATIRERGLAPEMEIENPVKINDVLADTIQKQVQSTLEDARNKLVLWQSRVQFIEALNTNVEKHGGWEVFETQYREYLDTLIS